MRARAHHFVSAIAVTGALLMVTSLPAGAATVAAATSRPGTPRSSTPHPRVGHSRAGILPAVRGAATPPANRLPGRTFLHACLLVSRAAPAQRRCESAALPVINAARASEGVGPMQLPAAFATMSAPLQFLVVTDLERVGRGLPAAAALSPALDGLAQAGANTSSDPPMPSGAGSVGANWAGGLGSTLLTDFLWMYDDGPGSFNLGCTSSGAPGCWVHRRNILAGYQGPLLMGAATAGTSAAIELVGGATRWAAATPSWRSIAATVPVGMSSGSVSISAAPGHTAGRHVTIWATAAGTVARFTLRGGGRQWWLIRSSCRLRAGGHCNVWFGYRPAADASRAALVVSAVGGSRSVALRGRSA